MQGKQTSRPGSPARKPTTSLRLSRERLVEVDRLVRRTGMRSRTEFIEQAIDRYVEVLRDAKIVVVRNWTDANARDAVLKFLRGGKATHVSDIIEALGMAPDQAFRVVDELMEEEAVDRAA